MHPLAGIRASSRRSILWVPSGNCGHLASWSGRTNSLAENCGLRSDCIVVRFLFTSNLSLSIGQLPEGDGFSGAAWKNSETMRLVEQFSPGGTLYSNNPTAIYFVLGRQAISIPEQYDRVVKKYRPEFEQNLTLMRQRLKEPGSA